MAEKVTKTTQEYSQIVEVNTVEKDKWIAINGELAQIKFEQREQIIELDE
jgi:uncharacterized membrane protein YcgQ (UPF0703/DUF1980 family)